MSDNAGTIVRLWSPPQLKEPNRFCLSCHPSHEYVELICFKWLFLIADTSFLRPVMCPCKLIIFSLMRFGGHVVLAICCSEGDNNAASVRVKPVCWLICGGIVPTLGIGVLGSGACAVFVPVSVTASET